MSEQARLTDFGPAARIRKIAERGREAIRDQGVSLDAL